MSFTYFVVMLLVAGLSYYAGTTVGQNMALEDVRDIILALSDSIEKKSDDDHD